MAHRLNSQSPFESYSIHERFPLSGHEPFPVSRELIDKVFDFFENLPRRAAHTTTLSSNGTSSHYTGWSKAVTFDARLNHPRLSHTRIEICGIADLENVTFI